MFLFPIKKYQYSVNLVVLGQALPGLKIPDVRNIYLKLYITLYGLDKLHVSKLVTILSIIIFKLKYIGWNGMEKIKTRRKVNRCGYLSIAAISSYKYISQSIGIRYIFSFLSIYLLLFQNFSSKCQVDEKRLAVNPIGMRVNKQ